MSESVDSSALFDREARFVRWLETVSSTNLSDVPQSVLDVLDATARKEFNKGIATASVDEFVRCLKLSRMPQYIEFTNAILCHFNNPDALRINAEEVRMIRDTFKRVDAAWKKEPMQFDFFPCEFILSKCLPKKLDKYEDAWRLLMGGQPQNVR